MDFLAFAAVLIGIVLFGSIVLLAIFLSKLAAITERLERTVNRMETATKVVAGNLADSIERADHADPDLPGASADAALRTGNDGN